MNETAELDSLRQEVNRLREEMNRVLHLLDQDESMGDPKPEYPSFEGKHLCVRQNKMRIPFTVDATDTGVEISLLDKRHSPRLVLSIGEGPASLELRNAEYKVIAQLTEAPDGSGQFAIFDKDGQPRTSMRVSDFGGVVNVVDSKGKALSAMTAGKHGGHIFVVNDHHNLSAKMEATGRGGLVAVHEPSGQLMGWLMGSDQTGACTICGPQGNEAVSLIANDSGGGIVINDEEGNSKAVLP